MSDDINETSRDWAICDAVDCYRAPRNEGDERTLSDFLADIGVSIVSPAATPQTLCGMIAAIYGELDAEDCARIDREWARMRGYILPTDGTSTVARSFDSTEAWCRLAGEAIDALDTLSADDEFFGSDETRQDFASRRADELRSKYPPVSRADRQGGAT